MSKQRSDVFTEGMVGSISTFNPMFVTGSDIDRALFELVYTRLIEIDDQGEPLPALAYEWDLTEDGRGIRFLLREDMYWHDGEEVTAQDVEYTIKKAIKLSDQGQDTFGFGLSGVDVTSESDHSIVIHFEEIVSSVYESLSVFILPEHIISNVNDRDMYDLGRATLPIGSGPYFIRSLHSDTIDLSSWEMYPLKPNIKDLRLIYFTDEKSLLTAFKNNLLDAVSNVDDFRSSLGGQYPKFKINTIPIDQRKKMLYFNLRNSKLQSLELRTAIVEAIDREQIVENIPEAYKVSDTPLSEDSWAYKSTENPYPYSTEKSAEQLVAGGYVLDEETGLYQNSDGEPLTLSIVYLDNDTNRMIAEMITEMLKKVGVTIISTGVGYDSLINEVLATRNFELLLIELEITADPDQYNLWHSTKKNYPDLNIAGYEYNRVDVLLERARLESDRAVRSEDYRQIYRFITNEIPALVLYEPSYTYIIHQRVTGVDLNDADFPYKRYANIVEWKFSE
ncbi:hypothetical protein KC685_02450 [Candidatus Dojkabacteria bacterium]|uniref:Solute-binding protein family 5 domain-containing protein n=1 Tax=Candidatus Dojkabacteria bacterium TaxID=2099670 RepID=A0A955KWL8_9BACT|nr:hypothetical protein [Candidatus Dojkabacteria bacterium]